MNQVRLIHIEAKRDKKQETLAKYKIQAMGETLATMVMTENKYGLWCLTSGHEWLFGLLEAGPGITNKHRSTNFRLNGEKRSYMLEPIILDFESPIDVAQYQLKQIFFTLVYFVSTIFFYDFPFYIIELT
ncbi:hypothetical protein AMATHDRAFT_51049 [Amanita thiersii Skay4041]|uniref:Uncharacterized protein n=1 Tax=Amanita thiersii Skay4041 TaxID=703135 RepID=A0A2A9NFA0_9AGAR|nr:hypothetical protein AMATHDRAFT_51049 [Amanita thiersii Skay4041]